MKNTTTPPFFFFLQINFFKDHTKVILCPLMGAVTYIDEKRRSRTFRFDLIKEHGCSEEISTRLQYVLEKVETMLSSHNHKTAAGAGGVSGATSAVRKQYPPTPMETNRC